MREQTKVVGHAVRAMYMLSAMADLAAELDDEGLKRACETLWRDVTTAQMYVTAGLGPKETNEGFTEPYDLPNETAYAETCASVALIFWAQRMLHLDLDGDYADVMERALFNGALSGLSREGTHYFYSNPLESRGQHKRWAWHICPCCTMNVSRLVASVGGYFLSTGADGVAFHLYGGLEANVAIGGTKVALRETSDYPWSGDIRIEVDPEAEAAFDLKLRVPGWAKGAKATVNGEPVPLAVDERLCDDPSPLEQRRRRDAHPANAGRAPVRASQRAHGRRARGPEARSAHLLRRGGRQSRAARPDAANSRAPRRSRRKSVRTCSAAS